MNTILEENPNPTEAYLEILGNYLLITYEKDLLSENRLATIQKHETSLEGLAEQFENSEDGVYNLIDENKERTHYLFQPHKSITSDDVARIAPLRDKRDTIDFWENKLKHSSGRDAYICKQAIIEHRKDQYLIKELYDQPIQFKTLTRSNRHNIFPSAEWVDPATDTVHWSGASFCDKNIVALILDSYPELRQRSVGRFLDDTWYMCEDFAQLYEEALAPYPMYQRIAAYKWDLRTNNEIQEAIEAEFHVLHSLEYISQLWRHKIPLVIAEKAQENYLLYYHTMEVKSRWKKCNRCGQVKLAHPHFFSINGSTKDGLYSICKQCRRVSKEGAVK